MRKLGSPLGDLATKVFKEALDGVSWIGLWVCYSGMLCYSGLIKEASHH